MKFVQFERVEPDQLNVGDIVLCHAHDDQWEQRTARVISIERDDKPGVYRFAGHDGGSYAYAYQLWLICRHVNLKRLDAPGGEPYRWHRFPWNGVTRYLIGGKGKMINEENYTTWSIEKFCRLIERWREGAHMAPNRDTYRVYKELLEPAESAFEQLHPRAYQNFEKRFHEQFH